MRIDASTFAWLNDEGQLLQGWNNLTRADLQEYISNLIGNEISPDDAPEIFKAVEIVDYLLSQWGIEDGEPVISVKVDDGDLIEYVSGPAIYLNEDSGIICRVGDKRLPVTVKGGTVTTTIGSVGGDIEIESVGEDPNKFLSVNVEIYFDDLGEGVSIPVILDTKERPDINAIAKAKFKAEIKAGNLAQYLRPEPSGETYLKPRDLEVGEYAVTAISENEPHEEYGRSWKVTLEGVGPMMTTGKRLHKILATNFKIFEKHLANGNPLTFAISSKKELSQGVQVSCGFFKRAPQANRLVKSARPMAAIDATQPAALPQSTQTIETKAETIELDF